MNFNPIDLLNGTVDKVGDAVRDTIGLGRSKPTFNDKSYFDLDAFKAQVLDKGFAEEDRFEVFMGTPLCLNSQKYATTRDAAMRVESVYFPPMSIYTKQSKIFGPAEQRPIMADYGGDGLTITFLVDRDMQIKRLFDVWMRSIVDYETQTVAYPDDYTALISIRQLDRSDNCTYQAVIQDAFPKSMQIMNLSSTSTGQFHRLQVTFGYRKWHEKTVERDRIMSGAENAANVALGGDPKQSVADMLKARTNSLRNIADKAGLNMSISKLSL